jgi:hypothetical protein
MFCLMVLALNFGYFPKSIRKAVFLMQFEFIFCDVETDLCDAESADTF